MPTKGKPIPQDLERFRYLAQERTVREIMPAGYSAPLDFKPTRTLIAERLASLKNSTALATVIAP